MSTPLVLRGLSIEVCGSGGREWVTVESSFGADRITAWIDVHSDDDLDVPSQDVVADAVPTGEALLF